MIVLPPWTDGLDMHPLNWLPKRLQRPVAALGLVLLLLPYPSPAAAHGDASWIMNNPNIRHCCGPKDCKALPAGSVVPTATGWHLKQTDEIISYNSERVYRSIDGQYWRCEFLAGPYKGQTRCFFPPDAGT